MANRTSCQKNKKGPSGFDAMKIHKVLLIIIILAGVFFRCAEFFSEKSLWFDEAKTALKIEGNTCEQLINGKTITKKQPYPAGFLIITKWFSMLGGNNELSLRLFPFVCGILALFLFYRVAHELFGPAPALLALSFFALSPNLIYYSSELKPYSSDILFTVIFLHVFYNIIHKELSWQKIILFGVVGGLAFWVSYPIVFVAAGMGLSTLVLSLRQRDMIRSRKIVAIGLLWAAHFCLFYFLYIRYFTRADGLVHYWRVAYMPLNIFSFEFMRWFMGSFALFFKINLKFPVSLSALTMIMGSVALYKEQRKNFFLLGAPILLVLFASGLKIYPFQGRVILFLVPIFMLVIVHGVYKFIEGIKAAKYIRVLLIIFFLYYPVLHTLRQWREPYGKSEIKPVMRYLSDHRQPGDKVYLYYSTQAAFRYYAEHMGLMEGDYIIGIDSREDPGQYKKDLEQLRGGERVWVVFSDVFYERDGINEGEYFLDILNRLGRQLDAYTVHIPAYSPPAYLKETFSAGLYLYDLSAGTSTK